MAGEPGARVRNGKFILSLSDQTAGTVDRMAGERGLTRQEMLRVMCADWLKEPAEPCPRCGTPKRLK